MLGAVAKEGLPYNSGCRLDSAGYHRIIWTVSETQGDTTEYVQMVRLEDCVGPDFSSISFSTVVIPSSGEVRLWAIDYYAYVTDDCAAMEDLVFSFDSSTYQPYAVYNCDDLYCSGHYKQLVVCAGDAGRDINCNNTIEWQERNMSCDTITIFLNDALGVCHSDGFIQGVIKTPDLEPVSLVDVQFFSEGSLDTQTFTTWLEGYYFFVQPCDLDSTFFLRASRNDIPTNGMSTLDLIKIQKHLLGIQLFDSPYKLIAGDANRDEKLSALDLLEMRKLLLGLYAELPNSPSWVMIPEEFEFETPENPWPFDEAKLALPYSINDFIGVKIGDVDGNVVPSLNQIEYRTPASVVKVNADLQEVAENEVIEVPVKAQKPSGITGLQFTMELFGLEFVDILPGIIGVPIENVATHENAVTAMWYDVSSRNVDRDDVLFTFRFKANRTGRLNELLSMSSRITDALVVVKSGGEVYELPLALDFVDPISADATVDFVVSPNPATREIVIQGEGLSGMYGVSVVSIDGRQQKFYSNIRIGENLDIGDLGDGLYFVTLSDSKTGELKGVEKLVVGR